VTHRRDVRGAVIIVAAMAVVGVLLGLVWLWWSPGRPIGFVIAPHAVQPDETEAFVASDGRFAVLTVVIGLVAGTVVWFVRSLRGPFAAGALAVGGLAGAWLTERVGNLFGGGHASGPNQTVIDRLPLSVHMSGLRVLEAAVAILAYGLFVSFAASDDLGRADSGDADSVVLGGHAEHGWSHSDAPGALHQSDLAP
jgi:hypothetical protein